MEKGKKNLLNCDRKWHYAGTSDGLSVRLGGCAVLSGQWESTGRTATVRDPHWNQTHTFSVYTAVVNGRRYEFALGEFSNSVYGYFTK